MTIDNKLYSLSNALKHGTIRHNIGWEYTGYVVPNQIIGSHVILCRGFGAHDSCYRINSTAFRERTYGVGGVVAMLVDKERRPLGEHVLLRTRIGRRTSINCAGRLNRTTQWSRRRRTSVRVLQLERGTAGDGRRDAAASVAVRCHRRQPVLAALYCLLHTYNRIISARQHFMQLR